VSGVRLTIVRLLGAPSELVRLAGIGLYVLVICFQQHSRFVRSIPECGSMSGALERSLCVSQADLPPWLR